MTWQEFVDSFQHTTIAVMIADYQTTSMVIESPSTEQTIMSAIMILEVKDDEPFFVNLEWPSVRMLQGCPEIRPIFTIGMARIDAEHGTLQERNLALKSSYSMTNARIRGTDGKGMYIIFIYAEFPDAQWLEEITFTTFADNHVDYYILTAEDDTELNATSEKLRTPRGHPHSWHPEFLGLGRRFGWRPPSSVLEPGGGHQGQRHHLHLGLQRLENVGHA
eukprot:CAMPEP_0117600936 /NCGR_PEP_ID=MMETSP0784-20121206/76762_1 /TAXON_ID=39447 /ORGANISM="" /LENGTH=219 /DNA_ID=CAMNT_0005403619 /DNA_START=221 /DNA_END=880 /DNA_ORIENTATION=+